MCAWLGGVFSTLIHGFTAELWYEWVQKESNRAEQSISM